MSRHLGDAFGEKNFEPEMRFLSRRIRATVHIPETLLEQMRDAVVFLQTVAPAQATLASLAERAFRAELDRLGQLFNDGNPFPRRTKQLKGGRPRSHGR